MNLNQLNTLINNLASGIAVDIKALNLSTTTQQSAIDQLEALQGDLTNLTTTDKTSLVAALNELKSDINSAVSTAVTDLIGGADADNDTLKEIADKVAALAQHDQGLVSALQTQTFTDAQKTQARTNIAAAAASDVTAIENQLKNPPNFLETYNAAKAAD